MENTKTKTLQALKENRLFDFIASHYWEMDKDELGAIAKELAYALDNALHTSMMESERREILRGLSEQLKDQLSND